MTAVGEARRPDRRRAGWWVIAEKELGDHVTSLRFIILLLILAAAVAVTLYFASARIRDLAPQVSGIPAVFIALFTLGPEDIPILRFDIFVGFLAPLLGIAFGFDSVNVERSEGTLPRLVAQPIHRDDVINGKFAAGLAVIAVMLAALAALVAGVGIVRLGIVPSPAEVIRLIVWYLLTLVYVGFWLAFATLLSVVIRRAAASALFLAFGLWVVVTFFWDLMATVVANAFAPASGTADQVLRNLQVHELLTRFSPATLYQEASLVVLNPGAGASDISVPGTIGQFVQGQQQIPSLHSLDQSLLLVWPQVVILVALMVLSFAAAYVLFMRQEIRA